MVYIKFEKSAYHHNTINLTLHTLIPYDKEFVWPTTEEQNGEDEDKKTSDTIDLHKSDNDGEKSTHCPIPRPRKLSTKKDEKYLDTKSLDSIGLTDVESIMTLDDLAPTKTSSQVDSKDSGTECTTLASPLCRTKQSSQKVKTYCLNRILYQQTGGCIW